MDVFDSVKVDQMVGNNVSVAPLQRTILCLNARRETHQAGAITNQNVVVVTNVTLSTVTNQTVTVVTNQTQTMATNQVVNLAQPVNSNTTNNTVTSGSNLSLSKANNQTIATASHQTLLSQQITVTTNNVSIMTADNQAISAETNKVITTLTNVTLSVVTNVVVMETNLLLRDYYLYTELIPPPDFVLQSGESLVLLIDGVRHGFAPVTSQTAFVARKGFASTLYKVPPDVLVDIANARDVRIRLKGVNSVVERKMSDSSKYNFKKFLLKYFVPEPGTSVAASPDFPPATLASQSAH